jgi:F-type H+-transporting ATPase subunit gamma
VRRHEHQRAASGAEHELKEWAGKGATEIRVAAIGNKGLGFMNRIGAKVVSQVTQLGDTPHLEKLIGPVKVMIDASRPASSTRSICPTPVHQHDEAGIGARATAAAHGRSSAGTPEGTWDYIYEPDPQVVIDELLLRYVEALVYQAVAENMASEQSARMVAMKAASDNAGSVIGELQLVYNKTRQAAITKELSEIVGGAAAV